METNAYRVEFGVGLEFNKSHERISFSIPDIENHKAGIRKEAVAHFGICTIIDTKGAWRHADGKIAEERGCCVVLMVPTLKGVAEFAAWLKKYLNQEAVALTITPCHFELV